MKKLRVAIIACGMMGQQHTEAVRRIPGTEVVALADPNPAALAGVAEKLGIEQTFTDYRQMIETVQPDAVHNCTPNGMHYEINKYCIEHGVHVYCEKPLAVTLEQAEELTALARTSGVLCAVNFNYRHNAVVQEMRQRVLSGEVGRLFLVTGQYVQDWMMYDTDYNWRLTDDQGGRSRAVADIGSHWFDTAQWATGRRITAVRAELLTVHQNRKKPAVEVQTFAAANTGDYELIPITSEDAGFILVRFEDGTLGQAVLSQVSGGHKNDLRLEIAGERCALEWQQESPDQLRVGTREAGTQILRAAPDTLHGSAAAYATLPGGHPVAWSDALRNSVGAFYHALRGGSFSQEGQPFATFADGLCIMRLVEACLASSESGQWVELNSSKRECL